MVSILSDVDVELSVFSRPTNEDVPFVPYNVGYGSVKFTGGTTSVKLAAGRVTTVDDVAVVMSQAYPCCGAGHAVHVPDESEY